MKKESLITYATSEDEIEKIKRWKMQLKDKGMIFTKRLLILVFKDLEEMSK